jgi:hypothetical protein
MLDLGGNVEQALGAQKKAIPCALNAFDESQILVQRRV